MNRRQRQLFNSLATLLHLPFFLRDRLGFLERCAAHALAKNQSVARLQIGEPTLLLLDARDIEHVLVGQARNYEKSPRLTNARGKKFSGDGLLTSSAREHLPRRRALQPMFGAQAVSTLGARIVENTTQFISALRDGQQIDLHAAMMNLAQRNILQMLLGDIPERDLKLLARAVSTRREYLETIFQSLRPFPEYWPSRAARRFRHAQHFIDRYLDRAIAARQTALRNNVEPPHDLLTALLSMHNADSSALSTRQVRDEALTLLITGYETVGEALSWACVLLAQNPQVAAQLHVATNEVLRSRAPRVEDLPQLAYAGNVIQEAMRLYPPTWIFIRIARENDVLPSGETVCAGTKIYLCPWIVQRQTRYFPNPLQFEPERFAAKKDGESNKNTRPKFAHFPFGGGARRCIGEPLALMQSTLVLTILVQQFDWELLNQNIKPVPGMTLRPRGGVPVVLHQRQTKT